LMAVIGDAIAAATVSGVVTGGTDVIFTPYQTLAGRTVTYRYSAKTMTRRYSVGTVVRTY